MQRSTLLKSWNETKAFRKILLTLVDCVTSVSLTIEIETCTAHKYTIFSVYWLHTSAVIHELGGTGTGCLFQFDAVVRKKWKVSE